jgi:cell division septum initiation protein DivIVA
VTDSRMKDRVKGLLSGTGPDAEGPPPDQAVVPSDAGLPRQALQVLTLAQRTAEEHLASARQDAEKIRAEARSAAEQVAKDAQGHAETVRRDADKALSEARAAAARVVEEAQAHADHTRQQVETMLSEARAQAEAIVADAQTNADELRQQAEQRYQDVVGSLAAKREALQQQIEALEQFDREYRARLTKFMQGQLRALWVDEPNVTADVDENPGDAPAAAVPAQRQNADKPEREPALKNR